MTLALVIAAWILICQLMWLAWARPRLVILRQEAQRTRYRVPRGLVALYCLGVLLAPLTALWLGSGALWRVGLAWRGGSGRIVGL